jgi:thiazole/oxazole-forming peptide maturase SagD family component
MQIKLRSFGRLSPGTDKLERYLLSPLTGVLRDVSFVAPSSTSPRFFVAGGDLSSPATAIGKFGEMSYAHHVGGAGIFLDEALVRTFGEAVERYVQVTPRGSKSAPSLYKYEQAKEYCKALPLTDLRWFTRQQCERPNFPFSYVEGDESVAWVSGHDLRANQEILLPAQAVIVGYEPQIESGEKRLTCAVTTGTAVHIDQERSDLNALLELIQIDATLKQWYTLRDGSAEVKLDSRTTVINRILDAYWPQDSMPWPRFFSNCSVIDGIFCIECVIADEYRSPAIAVGLGCGLRLIDGMYRALREAVAVHTLARINRWKYERARARGVPTIDPNSIFNLDDNVTLYTFHSEAEKVLKRYSATKRVAATELPEDLILFNSIAAKEIIKRILDAGMRLYSISLTSSEAKAVGLSVSRFWSPDLIPLCLPSAPYLAHPRLRNDLIQEYLPHPFP